MTLTRNFLLLLAALVCAIIGLIVALGASIGDSTWNQWLLGSLVAYYGSLFP